MREDMYKVIVERPRMRYPSRAMNEGARQWRNSEDRAARVGIKAGYRDRKSLNENLAPLKRWLHKQMRRPWDKVMSELNRGVDRRNPVQAHIYEHIDHFVNREVHLIDGQLVVARGWGRERAWVPLRELPYIELFVHPTTGILLPNRGAARARTAARARNRARSESFSAKGPPAPARVISDSVQWHPVNGIWYEITLAELPTTDGKRADWKVVRYDALRCCTVGHVHAWQSPAPGMLSNWAQYGRGDVYAASKRQLSTRELRRVLEG